MRTEGGSYATREECEFGDGNPDWAGCLDTRTWTCNAGAGDNYFCIDNGEDGDYASENLCEAACNRFTCAGEGTDTAACEREEGGTYETKQGCADGLGVDNWEGCASTKPTYWTCVGDADGDGFNCLEGATGDHASEEACKTACGKFTCTAAGTDSAACERTEDGPYDSRAECEDGDGDDWEGCTASKPTYWTCGATADAPCEVASGNSGLPTYTSKELCETACKRYRCTYGGCVWQEGGWDAEDVPAEELFPDQQDCEKDPARFCGKGKWGCSGNVDSPCQPWDECDGCPMQFDSFESCMNSIFTSGAFGSAFPTCNFQRCDKGDDDELIGTCSAVVPEDGNADCLCPGTEDNYSCGACLGGLPTDYTRQADCGCATYNCEAVGGGGSACIRTQDGDFETLDACENGTDVPDWEGCAAASKFWTCNAGAGDQFYCIDNGEPGDYATQEACNTACNTFTCAGQDTDDAKCERAENGEYETRAKCEEGEGVDGWEGCAATKPTYWTCTKIGDEDDFTCLDNGEPGDHASKEVCMAACGKFTCTDEGTAEAVCEREENGKYETRLECEDGNGDDWEGCAATKPATYWTCNPLAPGDAFECLNNGTDTDYPSKEACMAACDSYTCAGQGTASAVCEREENGTYTTKEECVSGTGIDGWDGCASTKPTFWTCNGLTGDAFECAEGETGDHATRALCETACNRFRCDFPLEDNAECVRIENGPYATKDACEHGGSGLPACLPATEYWTCNGQEGDEFLCANNGEEGDHTSEEACKTACGKFTCAEQGTDDAVCERTEDGPYDSRDECENGDGGDWEGCDASKPTYWTCNGLTGDNFECIDDGEPGGYTTKVLCETACGKYECAGAGTDTAACGRIEGGPYDSRDECENGDGGDWEGCDASKPTYWTCNGGTGDDFDCSEGPTGDHATEAECVTACGKFTCTAEGTDSAECVRTEDGPYDSRGECEDGDGDGWDGCTASKPTYWTCNGLTGDNFECTDDGTDTDYATKVLCEGACGKFTCTAEGTDTAACGRTEGGPYDSRNECENGNDTGWDGCLIPEEKLYVWSGSECVEATGTEGTTLEACQLFKGLNPSIEDGWIPGMTLPAAPGSQSCSVQHSSTTQACLDYCSDSTHGGGTCSMLYAGGLNCCRSADAPAMRPEWTSDPYWLDLGLQEPTVGMDLTTVLAPPAAPGRKSAESLAMWNFAYQMPKAVDNLLDPTPITAIFALQRICGWNNDTDADDPGRRWTATEFTQHGAPVYRLTNEAGALPSELEDDGHDYYLAIALVEVEGASTTPMFAVWDRERTGWPSDSPPDFDESIFYVHKMDPLVGWLRPANETTCIHYHVHNQLQWKYPDNDNAMMYRLLITKHKRGQIWARVDIRRASRAPRRHRGNMQPGARSH